MKLVGMMCAWSSEMWIGACIENVIDHLDLLLINVSPHHKDFVDLEDRTEEIVKEYSKIYKRIVLVDSNNDLNDWPDHNKCRILNNFLEYTEPNDVVMIIDADEFYCQESWKEIDHFVKHNDYHNVGVMPAKYFCVDFWHYCINPEMERLFRTDEGFKFTPTQRPNFKQVPYKFNNQMFHYTMLLNPEMKRRYWKYSPIGNPKVSESKVKWLNEIYLKYEVDNPVPYLVKNKQITGKQRFWCGPDMIECPTNGLYRDAFLEHPECFDKTDLPAIKDFRRIYE
jgi:hypothetical protein